jgi:hypothetical protein
MRKRHKEIVQSKINEILSAYTEDSSLEQFDILHLYPTNDLPCIIGSTGYHDSKHFNLVGFNTGTNKKRDLGKHDGITFTSDEIQPKLSMIRIFIDGAMLVRFHEPIELIHDTQGVYYKFPAN